MRRWLEKLESDLENFARFCHLHEKIHNLEQALAEKDVAYQQLMEKAFLFATWLKQVTDNEADEAQDAKAFLNSPEVQARKEQL